MLIVNLVLSTCKYEYEATETRSFIHTRALEARASWEGLVI